MDKGIETRYCIHDSNHSETRDIEPTGIHSWDEGTVTKEATETETGILTYSCIICGETMQMEIPVKRYGWVVEDGEWHYYDSEGFIVTNGWAKDSIGWCWMDESGSITRDKWIFSKNEWYYLKSSGYMASNEWTKDSKGWMWMDSNGRIVKSKWLKYNNEWYYLKADGYMAIGTLNIDGKNYTFDDSGKWVG